MDIQNLTPGLNRRLVVADKPQLTELPQQQNPQQRIFDQVKNAPSLPLKSLRTVLSPELNSSLLEISQKASNGVANSTPNPLRSYNAISDFEQLDQLSKVIGIDVQV